VVVFSVNVVFVFVVPLYTAQLRFVTKSVLYKFTVIIIIMI